MTSLRRLTSAIISGKPIGPAAAMTLWSVGFYELLQAADQVRRHFKGERVNFCSIINARSGVCGEDCHYCAQSAHHSTGAAVYPLVSEATILQHLVAAEAAGARCFGIVTSGRSLADDDVSVVCAAAARAGGRKIRVSASLGELDETALRRLKASGVRCFHHNLETAESHFSRICTTHRYGDRVATVRAAKSAGLEVCSGGILGLGESREQRVEFAMTLRDLAVDSVPLNILNPVKGTPFENLPRLSCEEILRSIALFRLILPDRDISVCGGREANLRDLQSRIFHAGANGMMVGGYLTTPGRPLEQDIQMIKDLGLELNPG